jgi:hypothetical protein
MTAFKSLVTSGGTTQQIADADSLLVGTGIDRSTAGDLTIGGTTATSITLGSASIPVNIPGDVTTVGGTTFTTDATFEGNVTFGDGPSDTVTFAATTTVVSDINFGGGSPTYKITNLADGTNPNDAVNYSQLSAIVSGVSAVTATAPLLSSGGATPDISISTVGANDGDVLTYDSGTSSWGAAAPVTTPPGGAVNNVQLNDGSGGFTGTADLSFAANILEVNSQVDVTNGGNTLSLTADAATSDAATLDIEAATSVTATVTGGATFLLTPNSVQTLTYAASVALDFDPSLTPLKTVTLTGDIAFTSTNLGAARNISVRIIGDTVSRNLTSFPAGWTWLGGTAPTVLEANKIAILSLASFSTNDANVIASWSYDGSVAVTDVTASSPLASSGGTTPNISLTGTVPVLNGGTGQTSYTDGQLLIGNSTGNTLAKSTLTAGSGVSITNGAGTITIAATGSGGTVTSVDVSGGTTGLTTSGGPITGAGTITLAGTLGVANGGTGTSTAFTAGSVVFAGPSGVYAQDNANLFWDDTNNYLGVRTATPGAVVDIAAGSISSENALRVTASSSGSVNFVGSAVAVTSGGNTGAQDIAFNAIVSGAAAVSYATVGIAGRNSTTQTLNSYFINGGGPIGVFGSSRGANGSGVQTGSSIHGNVGMLGFADGSVVNVGTAGVAATAENNHTNVGVVGTAANTGTGTAVAVGGLFTVSTATGSPDPFYGDSAALIADNQDTTFPIFLARDGGTATFTIANSGYVTAKNTSDSTTAFSVQNAAGTTLLAVNTTDQRVGVGGVAGASLTHTFNVGSAGAANFCVASGGRIHTYDGTAPTNGQILIGDGTLQNFAKATITAGSGVSITNGAGSITIAATGSGGTVTSVDVSGGTTGLTTSGGPITGSGTITLAGTLAVSNGGTGAASITSGSLVVGNGTSAINEIAPGTNGQVLTVVGGAWAASSLPAATDYSVVAITTAQAANTAVTVAGAAAQANSASSARVAGIVKATNSVQVLGICTCDIESSITIAQGDVVYLSASEAGKVTKTAPSTSGQVIAELGIATANGSGAGGTVAVLWQPKSIVVL